MIHIRADTVICRACRTKIAREEAVQVAPKMYYCTECAGSIAVRRMEEPKVREENDLGYRALIQYVCVVFEIEAPTKLILSQIRRFEKDFHMKYKGMKWTIEYCVRYLEPPLSPVLKYGIAFVSTYYEEAKAFFEAQKKIKKQMRSVNLEEVTNKVHTITINESDMADATPKKMIDIAGLGVDD